MLVINASSALLYHNTWHGTILMISTAKAKIITMKNDAIVQSSIVLWLIRVGNASDATLCGGWAMGW